VSIRARTGSAGGFTLVELLVGIAIGGIFATSLFAFFFSGTEASRGHENQKQALTEARGALSFLTSDLRQAVGREEGESAPLYAISPTAIEIYLDDRRTPTALDATPGRVRYAIEGSQLIREVAPPTGASTWGPYAGRRVLVSQVVNGAVPLFAALTADGTILPATMTSSSAALVRTGLVSVRLVVGYRRANQDGRTELRTDIALRNAPVA
jgi:prepilin-type N-terminal cleavage/methylation domain-containing protein